MKFKVLKPFIDIHSKEEYTENQEIKMTVERSIEATTNLSKFGGGFFVAVEDEIPSKTHKDLTVAELKEELEKLNIDYPSDAKKAELLALFEGAGEQ